MTVRLHAAGVLLALLTWPSPANANSPAFAGTPLPNSESAPSRRNLGQSVFDFGRVRMGDAGIDVRLIEQRVEIDLHPAAVFVHTTLTLQAGERGAKQVNVGFPERLPRDAGAPLDQLLVHIDHERAAPVFDGVWMNSFDLSGQSLGKTAPAELSQERKEAWGESYWWHWPMDFPPGQTIHLDVRSVQSPGPFSPADTEDSSNRAFTYLLRPGNLWSGPVGNLEIRLHHHGMGQSDLRIKSESGVRSQDGDAIVWLLENMEPPRDLTLHYRVAEGGDDSEPQARLPEHAYALRTAALAQRSTDGAEWTRHLDQVVPAAETDPAARQTLITLSELMRALDPDAPLGRCMGPPEPRPAPASCAVDDPNASDYGSPIPFGCRHSSLTKLVRTENRAALAGACASAPVQGQGASATVLVGLGVAGFAALGLVIAAVRRRSN